MADETELRPCPFCGSEPYVHEPDFKGDDWQVGCNSHGEGGVFLNGETWGEAAERWNHRTEPGGCPTCTALAEAAPLGPIPHELLQQLPDGARIVHQLYLDGLSDQIRKLYEERGELGRRIRELERADG